MHNYVTCHDEASLTVKTKAIRSGEPDDIDEFENEISFQKSESLL